MISVVEPRLVEVVICVCGLEVLLDWALAAYFLVGVASLRGGRWSSWGWIGVLKVIWAWSEVRV